MRRILVLGGSGFVGRHVCAEAQALGARLTVPTRRLVNARHLLPLPWVDCVEADVHDPSALQRLVDGHDAVVNLIAILHGDAPAFERAHVALPRALAQACRAADVARVVHVSALGAATDGPSMYQRSKAAGEAALRDAGVPLRVLRPSVVFGAGDSFLNLFARLQALLPVMPLAGAGTRFQPVWVQDVAQAVLALLRPIRTPPVVEAVGPAVYTLADLVRLAGRVSGHPRPVIGLPLPLGRLQARLMELAPGPPLMSRDNVDSLRVDNVATPGVPGLEALGIMPAALEAIAPGYLSGDGQDRALHWRRDFRPR